MSLKILFLVDVFPKISETFILDQIAGLLDLGADVRIIASRPVLETKVHCTVMNYGLLDRTVYFARPLSKLSRVIRGAGIIAGASARGRLSLYKKPFHARSLYDLFLVDAFLKHPDFDIIHAHFGPSGLLAARLREWQYFDKKLVTTFHGYDLSRFVKEKGERVYDQLFSLGDLFLPVCDFFKNRLIELGCPPQKVIVHRMGISADRFKAIDEKQQDRVRLLSVSRLTEKKGLLYAIRAVRKVLRNRTGLPLEYNIVGDGELRDQYAALIDREGLSDHVKLLGWQDRDTVCKLIKTSDIFLLPSITADNGDMEGIPVSLMEAMSSGLPVVSTDHSGIPELVKDGVSGYLVPEKNADLLADRLLCLIGEPERRSRMGREGRRFVLEHHNNAMLNTTLLSLYQGLLAR